MSIEMEELSRLLQNQPKNSSLLKQLGNYYLSNGFYKQARDEYHLASIFSPRIISEIMMEYENYIAKKPEDIQARLALISFCIANFDIETATLDLEELLEIDPNNLQAYNILGKIYINNERVDDALALLENAMENNVADISISEMLAYVYLEKQRFEEAIRFYEDLPQNKNMLRRLAELYQRTGSLEKSAEKYFLMFQADPEVINEVISKLEELLSKNVSSIKIREYLSELYSRALKPEFAVKNLLEILRICPEKSDEIISKMKYLLKSYPLHPQATLALAETLAQKGNFSEAVEEYYKLIKNDPSVADNAVEGCKKIIAKFPEQFLGRQFLIETYLSQERISDALAEIKILLLSYPESSDWVIPKCREYSKKYPELRECLGYAYLAKGEYLNATQEAEALILQDKNNVSGLLLLAETLIAQKHCRKALDVLSKALKQSPFDPLIHKKYKTAKLKELELEAEQIKKRITEDEWKVSLHCDLGKIYLLQGLKEEALRELQISLKDAQKASQVHSLLGTFYRNEGLYDQSLDAFRKSLNLVQNGNEEMQSKIKFNMSLTYEAQGNVRPAIKMLDEIGQVDIDFPGLRQKLIYLKNTSMSSLQNKSLLLLIKDIESKSLLGICGREPKKSNGRQTLSVSFGQNYNISGLQFFVKGMTEASLEEFNLAVQLDPQYIAGINNMSVAMLMLKMDLESLNKLNTAHDIDPGSAIVLNNLGVANILTGNYEEAAKKLNEALHFDPEYNSIKLNLGDALYLSGKIKEAIDTYLDIPPYDLAYDFARQRLEYKIV